MPWSILGVLCISLGLTLALELPFALLVGIRNKRDLLLVYLVNLLTNPPVVLIYYLFYYYTRVAGWVVMLPLELCAVLVETYYYKTYGWGFKHPFWFSLSANAFSFFGGLLINFLL